ncbi:MAG: hypothetical protein WC453_01910 [Patescibacteria group bacterium]
MRFAKFKIIVCLTIGAVFFGADLSLAPLVASPAQAAANLAGRILLQVQDKGQAWYVNPLDQRRYYLGRPADAFNLMRSLGLGVSNVDLGSFQANGAPTRLAGRILLQVQSAGQAYYVDPLDRKLYYLGRPDDAFSLMRIKGLGITNADLAKIPVATATPAVSATPDPAVTHDFVFKYQGNNYEIKQAMSAARYAAYQSAPKTYTYTSATEPPNLREAFYSLFLQPQSGDTTLNELAAKLKAIAANNGWTGDQLADFTMAFIQSIPYDHAKLSAGNNRNTNPYYPYETLYLDRGVCSDKTFLAVVLFRKLGYGAAILDFPAANHSAVGLACPAEDSVGGSGYCYAETTNYFPIGVIPQSISAGQAQTPADEFTGLFGAAGLGQMEIYQRTSGQNYQGVAQTKAAANSLKTAKADLATRQTALNSLETSLRSQETQLSAMRTQLDNYYNSGQTAQYNNLVPTYNDLVNKYNNALADYQAKIAEYNQRAAAYNQALSNFYNK